MPAGRYGGARRGVDAESLAEAVVRAIRERKTLGSQVVEDCIFGHCYPSAEAPTIGRVVALAAGLPVEVPSFQVDRRCGSGLQAICPAAMLHEMERRNLRFAPEAICSGRRQCVAAVIKYSR